MEPGTDQSTLPGAGGEAKSTTGDSQLTVSRRPEIAAAELIAIFGATRAWRWLHACALAVDARAAKR